MAKSLGLRLAITCLAVAGNVETASAQEAVARSLADLLRIVRPGAEVVLIDRDGREFAGVVAR